MGKAAKKRHCPAIDGPITPVECGERRISVYACPASCPHALLEVQQIPDLETVEVIDLLAPDRTPFIVRDRKLAASTGRFLTLLTWIHPMPHFWLAFGAGIELPDSESYEPIEVVTEIIRHLQGPTDEPGMRLWLAENFVRFDHALLAVSIIWRRQMFATTDAKLGRAVYELRRPFAECTALLDELPEVDGDALTEGERAEGFADVRIWMDPEQRATGTRADTSPVVLGRVLLGQSHWRLEAFGAASLEKLRNQFEMRFGELQGIRSLSQIRSAAQSGVYVERPGAIRGGTTPAEGTAGPEPSRHCRGRVAGRDRGDRHGLPRAVRTALRIAGFHSRQRSIARQVRDPGGNTAWAKAA